MNPDPKIVIRVGENYPKFTCRVAFQILGIENLFAQ